MEKFHFRDRGRFVFSCEADDEHEAREIFFREVQGNFSEFECLELFCQTDDSEDTAHALTEILHRVEAKIYEAMLAHNEVMLDKMMEVFEHIKNVHDSISPEPFIFLREP